MLKQFSYFNQHIAYFGTVADDRWLRSIHDNGFAIINGVLFVHKMQYTVDFDEVQDHVLCRLMVVAAKLAVLSLPQTRVP
jgi:hypothetical protein